MRARRAAKCESWHQLFEISESRNNRQSTQCCARALTLLRALTRGVTARCCHCPTALVTVANNNDEQAPGGAADTPRSPSKKKRRKKGSAASALARKPTNKSHKNTHNHPRMKGLKRTDDFAAMLTPPPGNDGGTRATPDDPAPGESPMTRRTLDVDHKEESEEEHLETDEEDIVTPMTKSGKHCVSTDLARARRMATCHFFSATWKFEPNEEKWKGCNGIAADTARQMNFPSWSGLRHVKDCMRHILSCNEEGEVCTGQTPPRRQRNDHLIPIGSCQEQLIADLIEDGCSFAQAAHILNEHRKEEGITTCVGRTTVWHAIQRLKPKVTAIRKRQQGSLDENSNWCRVNVRWATQLMTRHGMFPAEELEKLKDDDGELPDCCNIDKLRPLDLRGVTFWDKVHKQVRGGNKVGCAGCRKERRFKRDPVTGKLDPNGEHADPTMELKMKCTEEARFSFGVAMKVDDEGNEFGHRLEPFNCSGKKLVTQKDCMKAFNKELQRPKELTKDCCPWHVANPREASAVCAADPVTVLKGIGAAGADVLESLGINTAMEFHEVLDSDATKLDELVRRTRLSAVNVNALIEECRNAAEGPPDPIDFRHAENPCEARFGAGWEDEVRKSGAMSGLVSVQDMIKHIVDTSREFFKGTEFENNWFFHRCALNLMTSNETKEWMAHPDQDHLKHWILPEHGLNDHIKGFKGRPPGNNANLMPLDNSLNKDHHDIVMRHAAVASKMPEDDPRKFSMTTPLRVEKACLKIWNHPNMEEGGPPGKRIVQDVKKTIKAIEGVCASNGKNTKVNVDGHRGTEMREKTPDRRGGKREKKKLPLHQWCHEDAVDAVQVLMERSRVACCAEELTSHTNNELEDDRMAFEDDNNDK